MGKCDGIVDDRRSRGKLAADKFKQQGFFLVDFVLEGSKTSFLIPYDGKRLPQANLRERIDGLGCGQRFSQHVGVHPFTEDFACRIPLEDFASQYFTPFGRLFHAISGVLFI